MTHELSERGPTLKVAASHRQPNSLQVCASAGSIASDRLLLAAALGFLQQLLGCELAAAQSLD